MSSSVHIDNNGKYILILPEGAMQGLDNTTLTAEPIYPITFTEPNETFVLSLHCNGINRFFFLSAKNIYQLKAEDPEIKDYVLYLGNISKDFTIKNMKNTGLKGVIIFFCWF